MTKRRLITGLIVLTLLGSACEQKVNTVQNKAKAAPAPFFRSDIWPGTQDNIDPRIGTLRPLD